MSRKYVNNANFRCIGARVVWTFQNQTEPEKAPHMLTNTCRPHKPPLSHHVPKKPVKQQWSLITVSQSGTIWSSQDCGTPRKQTHALNALQGCFFWTSSLGFLVVLLPRCFFCFSVRTLWGLLAQAENFLPPLILDKVQTFDDPVETLDVTHSNMKVAWSSP